jgi:RNA ligase (TIGR02306 family)
MRKMATIRKIDALRPIEGADAIECAIVGGWTCVVKKGEYTAGDLAVYCEIDSFIPTTIAPFLTKPGQYPKTFEGIEGERLRTVKLRGQLSQGLLLPLSVITDNGHTIYFVEGLDVSEALGITKYEAPVPAELAGEVKGMFPARIPKTDQERIQNLSAELAEWKTEKLTWTITEKCEGSSFTAFFNDGEFNVCSRNLMLKENADNTLWATAGKYDLKNKMTALGRNIAVQAELLGPGVQGNIYKLSKHMLAVFDIFDIDAQHYMSPADCKDMIEHLGLTSVPVLTSTAELGDKTIEILLKIADGVSVMGSVGCKREGLVWKCNERRVSFKTISNAYLLGEK